MLMEKDQIEGRSVFSHWINNHVLKHLNHLKQVFMITHQNISKRDLFTQ